MTPGHLFFVVVSAATILSRNADAQSPDSAKLPAWADTTGESSVYPIGDAVGVYRAALDLLYTDGKNRPSVIVMHDTAEAIGERPCPVACDRVWSHKSKIDTSAILAFARHSPKRPRIRNFGYSIPIVFVSYADRRRIEQDGSDYLATHHPLSYEPYSPFRIGFTNRFPGAWGLTTLSKVAFNKSHTQALVGVADFCEMGCGSIEVLFLERFRGRWVVIERIPTYTFVWQRKGNLQYRGPAGLGPSQSEIVADPGSRLKPRSQSDDAAIYRVVLDSLYSFQGEFPNVVVLTDRFPTPDHGLPAHKTHIDSALIQKNAFLETVHGTPDTALRYRLPLKIVLADSLYRLEVVGDSIGNRFGISGAGFWVPFLREFPDAWGMVGFSRIAFNLPHTQAIVYSNHLCGPYCNSGDTWILERKRESWRLVERLPRTSDNRWEPIFFPLRYIGLDAKPNSYRHRRVRGVFTNAVTNAPLRLMDVRTNLVTNAPLRQLDGKISEVEVRSHVVRTDSAGQIDFGVMPFSGASEIRLGCPDQSEPDSIYLEGFVISPGLDSTFSLAIDFRQCLHKILPPQPSGAEASIDARQARFVFSLRNSAESWDLSEANKSPGTTEYFWEVDWSDSLRAPDAPVALWLSADRQAKAPPPESLEQLIAGHHLEAMLECRTCDEPAVFEDERTDHSRVLANVEDGRIVFTVHGRDAVRKIFPRIPSTVTFRTLVRHTPEGKHSSSDIEQSQTVVVNCHSSDSTGFSRRRCLAPPPERQVSPPVDSTSPRRVKIVGLSYDGASLARNLDVRITSEDRKTPRVIANTGSAGNFSMLWQPRDSLRIEAICPRGQTAVGGQLALYLAPGRDTTLQLVVDPRRCAPSAIAR
jgi:hypothetical protein